MGSTGAESGSAGGEAAEGEARPAACLVLVAAWSLLFNVVGRFTWGWGPLSFAVLMASFALLLFARPAARRLARAMGARARPGGGTFRAVALLAVVVYVGLDLLALGSGAADRAQSDVSDRHCGEHV
jgi:cobalamin synthase